MGQDLGNTNGYGYWRLSEYYKKKCREDISFLQISSWRQGSSGEMKAAR